MLPQVENVIGSNFNDTFTSNALPNVLDGGSGNDTYKYIGNDNPSADTILEAAGADTLDFSGFSSGVVIDLRNTPKIENVVGSDFSDTLTGNALPNTLIGGLGDDTYKFVGSDDHSADTIIETAGEGTDQLDFSGMGSGVVVDLRTIANVEDVMATPFADTITGNALDNHLQGGSGEDWIEGREGIDILEGGTDTDTDIYSIIVGEVVNVTDIIVDDNPHVIQLPSGGPNAVPMIHYSGNVDPSDQYATSPDTGLLLATVSDADTPIANLTIQVLGVDSDDVSISPTGEITWTPDPEELKNQYNVTITVTDDTSNGAVGTLIAFVGIDTDGDGLFDFEEQQIGADPNDVDTDGDRLGDGYEVGYGLVPTDSDQDNNGTRDDFDNFDGDNLNNFDEAILNTDPTNSDTDGDGVDDETEHNQGSNPLDSSDNGLPPQPDLNDVRTIVINTFSDVSQDVGKFTLTPVSGNGAAQVWATLKKQQEAETHTFVLEAGAEYELRYDPVAAFVPDDGTVSLSGNITLNGIVIVEGPSLSGGFHGTSRVWTVYAPVVDLDFTSPDISDDDEVNPGAFVALNRDDDDDDGIADFQDTHITGGDDDFLELKLRELLPQALTGLPGTLKLTFNNTKVRLWKDRNKNQEIFSGVTELSVTTEHTIYAEGIEASDNLRDVEIKARYTPGTLGPDFTFQGDPAEDIVNLTVSSVDVTIDGLGESWEQEPGAVIWRNSDWSKDQQAAAGYEHGTVLPDYEPDTSGTRQFDPNYGTDYTQATVTWNGGLLADNDLQLTFSSDILVWNVTDWSFGTEPNLNLPDASRLITSGQTLTGLSGTQLDLLIEGIDRSSAFGQNFLQVTTVPHTAGNPAFSDQAHYTVVEVNAGVDGNRDTAIDFLNKDDANLLFWYNNDQETTDDGVEIEGVAGSPIDSSDSVIHQRRDLEDFAPLRLHIDSALDAIAHNTATGGGPSSPEQLQVTYTLELEEADDTILKLYRAASNAVNVTKHVQDESTAAIQVNDVITSFRESFATIGQTQLDMVTGGLNVYLFEAQQSLSGSQPTTPTLVFKTEVIYPDGTKTEKKHEIELDLRDFLDFYDRYKVPYTDAERKQVDFASFDDIHFGDATLLHGSSVHGADFFDAEENIVLVHGWNMPADTASNDWKRAFAETAFKRLYWQGFAGRFVAFDWPTYHDAEGPLWPEALNQTYNASEYVAYRSGRALKNLLAGLTDDTHLLAHSMGNIVVGEAFRQWRLDPATQNEVAVETYVAMQAAVSAGAYGDDADDLTLTPDATDLYQNFGPTNPAPYLLGDNIVGTNLGPSINRTAVGSDEALKWVNLYNPSDAATSLAWPANNLAKGTSSQVLGIWDYYYDHNLLPLGMGQGLWRFEGSYLVPVNPYDLSTFLHDSGNNPGKTAYEALAFLSQSSTHAVGTKPLPWWFDTNTNINSWLPDEGAIPDRVNHSFQFHYDAATTNVFWNHVKQKTEFDGTY